MSFSAGMPEGGGTAETHPAARPIPARSPARRASLALLAMVTCLALSATPALARNHEFRRSFAAPGSGPGELTSPVGVAVNEATGVVYVADQGDNRVEFFDGQSGAVLGEFNGSGLLPGEGAAAGSGKLPDEEATGRFDEPRWIAVDNSCVRLKLEGTACSKADPSAGDVYVVDEGHQVVDKYSSAGAYLGQITGATQDRASSQAFTLVGVAVDSRGTVLVLEELDAENTHGVAAFSDAVANAFLPPFTETSGALGYPAGGLAVDGADDYYFPVALGQDTPIVEFRATGGVLLAEEIGGPVASGVAVEVPSEDVYVDTGAELRRLTGGEYGPGVVKVAGGTGSLVETLAVSGGGGGQVAVDTADQTVYVVKPTAGTVDEFAPEAPGAPSVEGDAVKSVTADSAVVSAQIDPRSEPDEPATSYTFTYGACVSRAACPSSPFGLSVSGVLPANFEPDAVTATLPGLKPGVVYHMRVSAHNSHPGVAEGEERILTAEPAGVFGLLDERAWELVSPPDKHGSHLSGIEEEGVVQAATDGDAISYLASGPTEAKPAGNSNAVQVLSTRSSSGWSSRDIALPHDSATGVSVGHGWEYRFFASDLSSGLVQPFGAFEPALSPSASEQTPYLSGFATPGYRPLVTGCPASGPCAAAVQELADVAPGTHIQEAGQCPVVTGAFCGPRIVDATPDLSSVVISAKAALEEGAPAESLYEWHAGGLQLLSVLPDGVPMPSSTEPEVGSRFQESTRGSILRGAISSDGSRVVFSEKVGHLYLRDTTLGQTVELDAKTTGTGEGEAEPALQFASSDDSRVFFTDTQQLTSGSGSSGQTPDLYECAITVVEETLKCSLTDLTPSIGGESASVQGGILGGSEDATSLYFVANGVLTSEPNPQGAVAKPGDCSGGGVAATETCNLYSLHNGRTRFLATLSAADSPDWGKAAGARAGAVQSYQLPTLTARVSPNGRWLTFMSDRSLTGYDNRDVHSGRPDQEVYLYDAERGGSLTCASCNPTGAQPNGTQYKNGVVFGARVWTEGTWIAANVPGWTPIVPERAAYQSRYLSNSGRLFFNSSDALVPQDEDGTEDVYEYEPPGVGTCTTSSPTYGELSGGCLDLISGGHSDEESGFLDASENGDDVFFLTAAQLSHRDTDTSLDVYDAHVDGSEPETPNPHECNGEECQGTTTPPVTPTPGSLLFQGTGNPLTTLPPAPPIKPATTGPPSLTHAQKLAKALKQCRRDRNKTRRRRCETKARRASAGAAHKTTASRKGR